VTPPERLNVKKQLDLLRLRRQALRIAVSLFEVCNSSQETSEVSRLFEIANASNSEEVINNSIVALKRLAQAKGIPTDL
jgi:hypothetical protein